VEWSGRSLEGGGLGYEVEATIEGGSLPTSTTVLVSSLRAGGLGLGRREERGRSEGEREGRGIRGREERGKGRCEGGRSNKRRERRASHYYDGAIVSLYGWGRVRSG
jgi:hypothetical protein